MSHPPPASFNSPCDSVRGTGYLNTWIPGSMAGYLLGWTSARRRKMKIHARSPVLALISGATGMVLQATVMVQQILNEVFSAHPSRVDALIYIVGTVDTVACCAGWISARSSTARTNTILLTTMIGQIRVTFHVPNSLSFLVSLQISTQYRPSLFMARLPPDLYLHCETHLA